MAVSQIEVKILGKLAYEIESRAPSLAASLYKVSGLSIRLSNWLVKARRLRKLDITRDAKSRDLYYHIIWLAREGLSITEAQILTECQNGEQGRQCRVMAAKLRASLYHVLCLFHNYPPVTQLVSHSPDSKSSPVSAKNGNAQSQSSPLRSPRNGKENGDSSRRAGKAALRDPIPSMVSDASYVTNPYAPNTVQSPPPAQSARQPSLGSPLGTRLAVPPEAPRRTPTRPPGLAPLNISSAQASASFLLPPIDFVPMARESFQTAQDLATKHLSPCNTLRLSITLEHCAFLWDCCSEARAARHLARQAIRDVYASTDGMSDDEFADAAVIVQALGGIVRRESTSGSVGSRENLQAAVREVDPASVATMGPTTRTKTTGRTPTGASEQQTQQEMRDQKQRRQQRRERSNPTTAAQNDLPRSSVSPPSMIPMPIDRTIAISPTDHRNQPRPPASQSRQHTQSNPRYNPYTSNQSQHQYVPTIPPIRSPERLSTVHELSSGEDEGSRVSRSSTGRGGRNTATGTATGTEGPGSTFTLTPPPTHPPPLSATSVGAMNPSRSRSGGSLASTGASSDKLGKRRAVEQAEEIYRRTRGISSAAVDARSGSSLRGGGGVGGGGSPSRRGGTVQEQTPVLTGKRKVETGDNSGTDCSKASGSNRAKSNPEIGSGSNTRASGTRGKGRAMSDQESDGSSKRSRRRRT